MVAENDSEKMAKTTDLSGKTKASMFNLYAEALLQTGNLEKAFLWTEKALEYSKHTPAYETKIKICFAMDNIKGTIKKVDENKNIRDFIEFSRIF